MSNVVAGQGLGCFVNVTLGEIQSLLEGIGFSRVELAETAEVVFAKRITFESAPTIVRVYTGVLKLTGESRPAGKDAIRVCLGRYDPSQSRVRIFKTLPLVRRTGTWRLNLVNRINSIGDGLAEVPASVSEAELLGVVAPRVGPQVLPAASSLKCPVCGSSMVGPKRGRLGVFFGCSRFPTCRGLINVSDLR